MRLHQWLVLALVAFASCERPGASSPRLAPPKDVRATVNGQPITDFELLLRLKNQGTPHASKAGEASKAAPLDSTDAKKAALETVLRDELFAQRAVELGLDRDPSYLEEMSKVDAQVAEARRQALAKLLVTREVAAKAVVSEAEARSWFEANTPRVQLELEVEQVLRKGRPAIEAVVAALAAGKSFDEVASEGLPAELVAQRPWRLPPLAWQQVPAQWWGVVDRLEPNQVSQVIEGPNERFWVVKLVSKRQNPAMTFELAKAGVIEQLKGARVSSLRDETEKALRAKARVELHELAPQPGSARE